MSAASRFSVQALLLQAASRGSALIFPWFRHFSSCWGNIMACRNRGREVSTQMHQLCPEATPQAGPRRIFGHAYDRLEFLASRTGELFWHHERDHRRRRVEERPTDDKEEEDESCSFTMTITEVSPCAVGLVCLSGKAVEVNEESVRGVGFEFYSNDLRLMTARDLGIFARKELGLNGYTPPGVKTRIVKEGRVLDKYEVLDESVLERLLKRFETDEDKHRRIEDMYRRMYKGA